MGKSGTKVLLKEYGNASSPILTVRCLMNVEKDNTFSYPRASKIIERNCYIDDTITNMDTLHETISSCDELKAI